MPFRSAALAICLTAFSLATASASEWSSLPLTTKEQIDARIAGGEGMQMVLDIEYAPSEPNRAYLSTDTSQLWRSDNGGLTWEWRSEGIRSHGIVSIAVDPADPDTIIAAGTYGSPPERAAKFPNRHEAVYISHDGGGSWTESISMHFTPLPGRGRRIAFAEAKPQPNTLYAASDAILFRSTDSGKQWSPVLESHEQLVAVEAAPFQHDTVYLLAGATVYRITGGHIQSTAVLPGKGASLSTSRAAPTTVWVTVPGQGIFRSEDLGVHFTPLSQASTAKAAQVIGVSPVDAQLILIKADRDSLVRYPLRSEDGGRTWKTVAQTYAPSSRFDTDGFWFSSPFALHPKDRGMILTVSNGKGQIIRSSDGGSTWSYSGSGFTGGRAADILFGSDGALTLALVDHGIWKGKPGGPFAPLNVPRHKGATSVSRLGEASGTLFATIGRWEDKGLLASEDNGGHWSIKCNDLAPGIFANSPNSDSFLAIGDRLSTDKGRTWKKSKFAIAAEDERGTLYAINARTIQISQDWGENWSPAFQIPPSCKDVIALAVPPTNGTRIYLGCNNGVHIYDGKTWTQSSKNNGLLPDSFGMNHISCIAWDPQNPDIVYAGKKAPGYGESNGVFQSSDAGKTWKNINANLGPNLSIWSIFTRTTDGMVFIGTSKGVLFLNTDLTK